jgi:uncharacterized membrane protein YcaP (DUF421 family)
MDLLDISRLLVGPEGRAADLTWYQMTIRALLVYVAGVALVRIGKERFIGRSAVFDALLGFILGSVLSRAINGSAPLLETLAGSLGLVLIHSFFAIVASHSHRFGTIVKGSQTPLVVDGEVDEKALARFAFTHRDLEQSARLRGLGNVDEIETATFERNGEISIIPRRKPPRVIEVEVREGVQRIRIEIE